MQSSKDLVALVYLSSAAVAFSTEDLIELLEKSRQNNASLGITGMLLFKDGYFLQVLEGERDKVLSLYKKIGKDSRHRAVVALSQQEITQRDFPDWSMGFRDLNSVEVREHPGFSPFLASSLTSADISADPGRAKKLLLLFKDEKLLAKGAVKG